MSTSERIRISLTSDKKIDFLISISSHSLVQKRSSPWLSLAVLALVFTASTVHAADSCCSFNLKSCDPDKWCNASPGNCAACGEGGFWIDPATTTTCTARWAPCTTDADCCSNPKLKCIFQDNYNGCQLVQVPPTNAPTLPPLTTSGTGTPLPIPSGTRIASGSSEQITLPQPSSPSSLGESPINCPHDDTTLVNWDSLNLTPSVADQDVQIPANTRVLISTSIAQRMGIVTIPATSELVIGTSTGSGTGTGITIDAHGFHVQGKLTAGSESCRLEVPLTITLHGRRPSDASVTAPAPSHKGINVEGGVLNLHGKRYFRTWTRLAVTAEPGDAVIVLQDAVNWQVGQEIVLVTTAMKDSREYNQNEVHTIDYIFADDPQAIQLKARVKYHHAANSYYQAEVGLLTRTIKIQGAADDSEPSSVDPLTCTSSDKVFFGDRKQPCLDKGVDGYGAHTMVHMGGKGYVEGVEFYRVGQTNVMGRYPMHFHLLGDTCTGCYLKDSSVHRSYYRCISVHATNSAMVSENVAYDVIGYCYYLEDGVEVNNSFMHNLVAHVHMLGPRIASNFDQYIETFVESPDLKLPADVSASGFYITNVQNNVVGNAASGGWAGFAFPNLLEPMGLSRGTVKMRPSSARPLTIDGNTAHSTGWWWVNAGAFYFGGVLKYNDQNLMTYNPGRSTATEDLRNTCKYDFCTQTDSCTGWCQQADQLFLRMTNTKVFLTPAIGISAWSGRTEVLGYEAHDTGLSASIQESGVWYDKVLVVCRTGEPLVMPSSPSSVTANGLLWYDHGQEHIMTDSTFRNCGFRSDEYAQYDQGIDRGCGLDGPTACSPESTVFGFQASSDFFNPEVCTMMFCTMSCTVYCTG
jgi:hypothetical protein